MIARPETTDGIPCCRQPEKGGYPKKWTHKSLASQPDGRHIKKGVGPKK